MKIRRVFARAVPAVVAAAALALVTLVPQQAQASQGPVVPTALAGLTALTAAGSYYDEESGRLVVNVLGRDAEEIVRAAGALPRRARFSQARLDATRRTLNDRAAIPGTAWVTDPRVDRVVVTADSTVTGERLTRLKEITSKLGDTVTVRRIGTRLTRMIAGGDAIWGGSARCSNGFNVLKDGQPYLLTAGHCGNVVANWSAEKGGPVVATTQTSVFPGHDYSLAKYAPGVEHPGAVALGGRRTQPITHAAPAYNGESVWRSGSTTGVHGGRVTGLDATVNYQEGQVTGLIETSVCAEPGDSGGPLFDGDAALGLTSGGSGDCKVPGAKTYYQPVPDALAATGAVIG
ncbi:S1 family peptidase [Streptomyces sp. UNOB3_S3]|uniref:S1 family peptidase n=1 Tax=Streptomyces sp. UNOB3_S3 TaxID=2871682 RepID=UPI001E6043D5|nr:S1 family peptidase [Streptomyces sp. UNOB3_S3]MCC3775503.1 S1 family peptidase [Streptomyces sp. UNOB3_S3]